MALGRFVLLGDDDLSLAALFKSPLLDLDEDDLFAVTAKRPDGISVWRRLQDLAEAEPRIRPQRVKSSSAGKPGRRTSRRMISMPRCSVRMAAARPIFPVSGMKSVMCSTNSSA
jgi:ATP-dependent exoDNAse (exonuclease V) beta subunit